MYLQWDSQHPISSKYSVVGTLHHRASIVCSNTRLFKQEEQHLQAALTRCKYPDWALNRIKMKLRSNQKKNKNRNQNHNTLTQNYQQPYLVVPYYQGLSESVKRTCNKYWHTSSLQRRCHHQGSPDGTKRSRSHAKKKWCHIQIYM